MLFDPCRGLVSCFGLISHFLCSLFVSSMSWFGLFDHIFFVQCFVWSFALFDHLFWLIICSFRSFVLLRFSCVSFHQLQCLIIVFWFRFIICFCLIHVVVWPIPLREWWNCEPAIYVLTLLEVWDLGPANQGKGYV